MPSVPRDDAMNEKELMTEWVSSQRAKYKIIDSWHDIPPDEKAILKHHATTPLYHYIREANERGLLKLSETQGGKSGGLSGAPSQSNPRHPIEGGSTASATPSNPPARLDTPFVGPASQGGKGELPTCAQCHKEFTPRFAGAMLCFDCWKADHPTKRR